LHAKREIRHRIAYSLYHDIAVESGNYEAPLREINVPVKLCKQDFECIQNWSLSDRHHVKSAPTHSGSAKPAHAIHTSQEVIHAAF
tara:strand:- start:2231 stop:2488 length:258 start_codon:yes stop_codon:yes gene_type:complete